MTINKVWAVFFSATGTTKRVVIEIAEVLAEKLGVGCEKFDFTLPSARNEGLVFKPEDLVIIGTPVYARRVPNVLLKYLNIVKGTDTAAVPVVVYGNRDYDDALIELRDILENNNFHTIAAAAFVGEHSFSYILGKGRPDESDINIASMFAGKVAEKMGTIPSVDTLEPIGVKGIPFPYGGYYQPLGRDGNPIDIRKVKPLTSSDCNDCKTCALICPMGSIKYENTKEVTGICIKCGACIKRCPTHAKYFEDEGYLYHVHELEERFRRRAEPELFV
jgi:NAD-dependent dihydropyrimidine dehydrogenase PreA subunit/flavodoxin